MIKSFIVVFSNTNDNSKAKLIFLFIKINHRNRLYCKYKVRYLPLYYL